VKKRLLRVLAVTLTVILLLTCVTSAAYAWWYIPLQEISLEPMNYSCVSDCWCGPSSGVSIGYYYKQQYTHLPSPKSKMHDALHEYMDTGIFGATSPSNYGHGFVEMALHYGYDNFSYVNDFDVQPDDYEAIVNAIDNGWPVALFAMGMLAGFSGVEALPGSDGDGTWPCEVWHVIAIKGVQYYGWWSYTWGHRIICTDNYSGANNLVLSWDQLVAEVGVNLRMVIIKDVDPDGDGPAVEDFEWGSDGASLDTSGGEVDWTVSSSGSSVVEIDTVPARPGGIGTRSARFNKVGTSGAIAYYSLLQPSYIGFYFKKSDTVYAEFRNGDGSNRISVSITAAEVLRYCDTAYHNLGTVSANDWHFIEFKNIDWGAATYDIYVDGYRRARGAGMRHSSANEGMLSFINWAGSGEFWIDDITDLIS